MTQSESKIQSAYELAVERYEELGVDIAQALATLEKVSISLHCWQGDDVCGFENPGGDLTGGIAATGNYPGKARTADELRNDLDVVYKLLPGSHRLNLHAIYLEADKKIERNKIEPRYKLDAVEPKLFGLGSEAYVVGSMEFYSAYTLTRKILLTLDSGHFHPTETISDKISALLIYHDQLLLHVSRGVRWDSDHVVTFNDDTQAIANEIVRNDALERIHIGLDYFDASINRVAAWTIGARNTLRALLVALLEPQEMLRKFELEGDFSSRLALQEELKSMPFSAVWDAYCLKKNVPVGMDFMNVIKDYEKKELAHR